LAIDRVEATSPPTSTRAPSPNTTPYGLTRKIFPFDDISPRM
jgi:hypothetical protein